MIDRITVIFIHVNMILFNKQKSIVVHISKKELKQDIYINSIMQEESFYNGTRVDVIQQYVYIIILSFQ